VPLLIATGWRRSAADVNMMALYMNALFSPGFNPRMMACQHRRHQAGRVTRATGSGGRPSLAVDRLPPCVMSILCAWYPSTGSRVVLGLHTANHALKRLKP
jgi:hypothetical protein